VRQSRLLALLATCALPMSSISAASISEVHEHIHPGEVKLQDVQLEDIVASPSSFQNLRVRFRCMFVENGAMFDVMRTEYAPHNYSNLIVYDDHARIWEPQVRAKPVMSVFIAKSRVDASTVVALKKYQLIDLIGEVTSVMDGEPMITVHTIKTVSSAGAMSDAAVYHSQQGTQLSGESAFALADDHYLAALSERLPDYDRVMIGYLRGQNLMTWGQYQACAQTMRESVDLAGKKDVGVERPALAGMHFLLAKAIAETGESATSAGARTALFQEAIGHARMAVELDPEQGDAYAVLGITLAGLGQYPEARRQCEKAIRLRPNNAEVRWYLGRILDQEGSYEEAIEALRKAIDLTPKDHRIHKAIGAVYLHRAQKGGPKAAEDFVIALREYDIAIRLNGNDPETHFGSGQVIEAAAAANAEIQIGTARQAATLALAIERYKAAVSADPRYLPVRRVLANRYRMDNQPNEAITQLKAIVEIEPERIENSFELGAYLWSIDRKGDAVAAYEACAQRHPDDQSALYYAEHVSLESGNHAQGVQWGEKLLKLAPKHAPGNLDMAKLKLALGLPKEAIKFARQAEASYADQPGKDQAKQVQAQAESVLKSSK